MWCRVIAAPMIVLLLVTAGCDPTAFTSTVSSTVASATPETVLAELEAARQRKDWKAYVACLTPESHDAAAVQYVHTGILLQAGRDLAAVAGPQAVRALDAQNKHVADILAKHGLTQDRLAELANMPAGNAKDEQIRQLAASVVDKESLMAEMMAVLNEERKGVQTEEPESSIDSVSIQDDRATATVTSHSKVLNQTFTTTVTLRLTEKGWKVDHSEFWK